MPVKKKCPNVAMKVGVAAEAPLETGFVAGAAGAGAGVPLPVGERMIEESLGIVPFFTYEKLRDLSNFRSFFA